MSSYIYGIKTLQTIKNEKVFVHYNSNVATRICD